MFAVRSGYIDEAWCAELTRSLESMRSRRISPVFIESHKNTLKLTSHFLNQSITCAYVKRFE
jgi:hypothetical protein